MKLDNLIKIEKQNIRNSQLLIASATNDLLAVRELIAEKADINHAGVFGYTPLHCAVSCGYLSIVKLLLENGADVSRENESIETPLDIGFGSSINNQEILFELHKNIIDNSIDTLQRNQEIFTQNINSSSDSGNPVKTGSNNGTKQLENESLLMNKEVIKEINKKKDKIQSCLKYLKRLNNECGAANRKVTYKKANILLFFLEAIAFRDMDVPTDEKRERRKFKKSKTNKQDSNVDDDEVIYDKTKIKEEVIDYFVKNYYPRSFIYDQKVIDMARNFLFHETNRKITLEDVSRIIGSRSDVSMFFKNLEEYVTYICNNIDGRRVDNPEIMLVLECISKEDKRDMGKVGSDILKEELIELIGLIYNHEEWTHEKKHEILFSFLVNVSPAFQKEYHDLGKLRNKIIHEFHKYENVEAIIRTVFTKTVLNLRSRLFKCYYAKEVYDTLHDIKSGDQSKEINKRLSTVLKSFEENFEKKFTEVTQKNVIVSQEETEGCFEFKRQQTLVFPSNEVPPTIKDHVKECLKFMIIVDDSLIDADDVEDEMLMNENLEKKTPRPKNLSPKDKREIFEKIVNLKQLKQSIPLKYEEEKNELKNDLINHYGIQSEYLDEICRFNIETDDEDCDIAQIQSEEVIINTICELRRIQTTYHKLSKNDIIELYSKIVKRKEHFEIDIFKKLEEEETLTELTHEQFQRDISMLYKENVIDFKLKGKNMKLNTVSIVSDVLEVLYSNYNSYQIKFNNIEEAFKDKMFLDHLISLEIKFRDSRKDGNQLFDYYLGTTLKKLLNIDYTSPYIVSLIVETGNLNIMEQSDCTRIVEILLKDNSYVDFLNDLLKINCDGIDLLKTIWEKLPNQSLENIRQILEDPNQAKKIFGLLETSEEGYRSIELRNNFTKLMNNIVYNFYLEGSYSRALELLDTYVVDEIRDENKLKLLEALRLKGRTITQITKQKGQFKESKDEHLKVLTIYNIIIKTLEEDQFRTLEKNALYLLTLSHIAYTQLLGQKLKESAASIKYLYQEIKRFALCSPKPTAMPNDEEDFTTDILHIMKLKPYHDLIDLSEETKMYLNVLKIRESMAVVLTAQIKSTPKKNRVDIRIKAMKIYREVYDIQKKIQPANYLTTAGIMRRLAFAAFSVGRLIKNSDVEKSLHYFAEAIEFSTGASKIYEECLRTHPLNLVVSKLISKIIGEYLFEISKTPKYSAQHKYAIQYIKIKYTDLLTNYPTLDYKNKSNTNI